MVAPMTMAMHANHGLDHDLELGLYQEDKTDLYDSFADGHLQDTARRHRQQPITGHPPTLLPAMAMHRHLHRHLHHHPPETHHPFHLQKEHRGVEMSVSGIKDSVPPSPLSFWTKRSSVRVYPGAGY